MDESEAFARALFAAHWVALDVLHGPSPDHPDPERDTFDLADPGRRAYLIEQAAALIAAGWGLIPPDA
jgi:hypothetical protein